MGNTTAILLDGGFVLKKMGADLGRNPIAQEIYDFSLLCKKPEENLFRIYFYHCMPYEGTQIHPISQTKIDFSSQQVAVHNTNLFSELTKKNHVAFRKGQLLFQGWRISDNANRRFQNGNSQGQNNYQLHAADFVPDFTQKEVDIKIGLDVAWLASKHIVDKIILISGDTDFIPAMKFARREGVQVVVVKIGRLGIKSNFYEHSDEVREVVYNTSNSKWNVIP